MLEYKQLRYRRVDFIPGSQAMALPALRFPESTVPALRIAGQRLHSSADVVHALEIARPAPPLLPQDLDHRRGVEETVIWAREIIPPLRRLYGWGLQQDPAAAAALWDGLWPGVPRPILRYLAPRFLTAMGRRKPPDVNACLACLATVPALLDYIDARVDAGFIGDDGLNAGDFHAGMVARGVMGLADLEPIVAGRPADRLARRTFPRPIPRVAPFLTSEQMQMVS
jgi:glutathione S-transferase